jgi:hypothetical protein
MTAAGALSNGDLVWYILDEADAEGINQRRSNFQAFNHGHSGHKHPHRQGEATGQRLASGHIAHIGNPVAAGGECAAQVSLINTDDGTLNLRVLLDGSDVHWVCSVPEGTGPGTWQRRGPR